MRNRILNTIWQNLEKIVVILILLLPAYQLGAHNRNFVTGYDEGYDKGYKQGYQDGNQDKRNSEAGIVITEVVLRKNLLGRAASDTCLLRDILHSHTGNIDQAAKDEFLRFFQGRYSIAATDYEQSIQKARSKGIPLPFADYPEKAPTLSDMEQKICPKESSRN